MSKTKVEVKVVDEDLLKMLLEKISVLQSQVDTLHSKFGLLEVTVNKSYRGR